MTNYGGGGGGYRPSGGSGGGPSSDHLRELTEVVIAPGATVDVDVLDTSERFLWYFLLLKQAVTNRLTSVVVHGVSNGSTPDHSSPSEVGDIQNYNTNLVIATGSLRLQIKNNEANPITVTGQVAET